MEDTCEAVAALGLQAIALLCEDDVLEFYAAWRVVHRAFPKLPSQVGDPHICRGLLNTSVVISGASWLLHCHLAEVNVLWSTLSDLCVEVLVPSIFLGKDRPVAQLDPIV